MYTDDQITQQIQARKRNLQAALSMGFPPEPEPGFLCAYCAHSAKCQIPQREYRSE
jgi:hypothetical protein